MHQNLNFKPVWVGTTLIVGYENLCGNLLVLWRPQVLDETSPGSLKWIAHKDPPTEGRWTAFFVDMQYEGDTPKVSPPNPQGWPIGKNGIYDFTTTVSIVPNTFPYAECFDADCFGALV